MFNDVDYVTKLMTLGFGGTNFTRRENYVKLTSCGRSCLNLGFLGFHGFKNNKRRTKKNEANTVASKTCKFLSHNASC